MPTRKLGARQYSSWSKENDPPTLTTVNYVLPSLITMPGQKEISHFEREIHCTL
ncbi:hypothetical protein HOLleu_23647 [Holothuria leucospilota]|uniref:Uncharacterized protein n=1 Tax=Holothuria leucospilota TaxID=206669 RepID=A0A9Q1BVB5_HOLLE|nr:hypothetical protein HOLleu_23647 [Holothuria leucospilota]